MNKKSEAKRAVAVVLQHGEETPVVDRLRAVADLVGNSDPVTSRVAVDRLLEAFTALGIMPIPEPESANWLWHTEVGDRFRVSTANDRVTSVIDVRTGEVVGPQVRPVNGRCSMAELHVQHDRVVNCLRARMPQ